MLDKALVMGIEVGGGLVQDKDSRVLQERSGDGDTLFLTAREAIAPFANKSLVAFRKGLDQAVELGGLSSGPDVGLRRVRSSVEKVRTQGLV